MMKMPIGPDGSSGTTIALTEKQKTHLVGILIVLIYFTVCLYIQQMRKIGQNGTANFHFS